MKRIIYNTKLKKIVIALLLVMLLFPKILPYKVWAANCTAEELRTELNKYYELTGKSVSVNECQNIINDIVNGQGSITIENGTIKIKAPEDTIKEAFDSNSGGPYSDGVVDTIISNGWDWMGVQTISNESTSSKEENKETTNESNKGTNSSVAQDLQNILNSNAENLGVFIALKNCQNLISRIENSDSHNSVTISNNGTININSVSEATVIEAFVNEGGYDLGIAQSIVKNNYSFIRVTTEELKDLTEEEKDNMTEEEIIKYILLSKYQESITPEQLTAIIDAGKYTVTKDENGKITDADLNLTTEEMDAFGISDQGKHQIHDAQKEDKDFADLGGILLSPVFYLINFIADAVISITGSIMDPDNALDFGLGVLTNEIPTSKYTNTSDFEVDTTSFLPTNLIGVLFDNGSVSYQYPHLTYTPEEIFSGKIDLLSIDFISGTTYGGEQNEHEGWLNIRKVISQWYQILRMIAIIGLLSVLIYTGIKIIISANAKDKAKYKEWIMNWLMAVAILFFMHIIMAFIVAITGEFSKLMNEAFQGIHVVPSDNSANAFDTNLMGLVRFMIQSENFYIKVGYEVMYIALIWYTLKFTFLYLKRVLNMAFLTLIAPIVALTYPIDKINDGSAQGFDMWLKEYIFNALLQPMHCILYYVLVGSAVSIAATNPIYGIVVLAFMSEAEKLLKKIFGFGKAGATSSTNGGMVSAFAAGAIASNIGKIAKMAGGAGGKGGSGNASKEQSLFDNPKPTDKPGMDVFDGEGESIQQRMLDAYDEEKFGTDEYDPAEREAMAREANSPEGEALGIEEQRQLLRDQGWSEEDINDTLGVPSQETPSQEEPLNNNSENIHTMAENKDKERGRFSAGAKAVGKRLIKPVWDADKSYSYNFKRLARGAGKAAIGFSLGTAAAAVQAGISITDGKYNPAEAIASMAAGYAGAGKMLDGMGSIIDTYKEGALPTDSADRKAAIMERAQAKFADRDDVIAFNKKNYAGKEKEAMERQREHYLTAGVTDLKEMKSGMKYADTLIKQGMSKEDADRRAAATIDFKKTLQEQGQAKAVYDKEKQQKYIQSMVDKAADGDKAKVRARYENAFKAVAAYDAANN